MFNMCIKNLYAVFWIIIFLGMASSSSLTNIVLHTVVPGDVKIQTLFTFATLKKNIYEQKGGLDIFE